MKTKEVGKSTDKLINGDTWMVLGVNLFTEKIGVGHGLFKRCRFGDEGNNTYIVSLHAVNVDCIA